MKDTSYIIRKAFFEALNGELSYNGDNVPVYDMIAPDDAPSNYVILSTQTTRGNNTLTSFKTDDSILVDIVSKTGQSITRDIVDNIANQVFLLILPSINSSGLPTQSGFQIGCITVSSDQPFTQISSETTNRRIIRFSLKINQ